MSPKGVREREGTEGGRESLSSYQLQRVISLLLPPKTSSFLLTVVAV